MRPCSPLRVRKCRGVGAGSSRRNAHALPADGLVENENTHSMHIYFFHLMPDFQANMIMYACSRGFGVR
jgi:hypothetical protein